MQKNSGLPPDNFKLGNEKSFPDIVNVIKLSDLYNISLDQLLKGDEAMIEHLGKKYKH